MRPYICISHASADADAAQRFLRELTRYGFRYEAPDESVPRREREACLLNAEAVIVLTSHAAAESGICAADIRLLLGRGRQVLCVSLEENALDSRFCSDREENAERIVYPAGEEPDRDRVADYFHRLYLKRLCRCTGAFSAVRCVDDAGGRLIRLAVLAYRVCSGEKFARRDEYAAAVQAVGDLADIYRTGKMVPMLESEAVAWLERGAALGQPESMLRLAEWKITGGAVRRDPAGALALGSSGPAVLQVQRWLNVVASVDQTADFVPESGQFDAATQAALESYQLTAGLEPLGVVDADTWESLRLAAQGLCRECQEG